MRNENVALCEKGWVQCVMRMLHSVKKMNYNILVVVYIKNFKKFYLITYVPSEIIFSGTYLEIILELSVFQLE